MEISLNAASVPLNFMYTEAMFILIIPGLSQCMSTESYLAVIFYGPVSQINQLTTMR